MNVPDAVKVNAVPAVGLSVGETLMAMAVRGPVFTVTVQVALKPPELAVMVAVPGGLARLLAAVTVPELFTVATVSSDDVQFARPLRSFVLSSS